MQWVLLATSLLCRAWKALGVVLLGMAADGAGLTELSAAEPSLQNKQKKKKKQAIPKQTLYTAEYPTNFSHISPA